MSGKYVSEEDGQLLSFPYDWRQTFHHPFSMSRVMNESLAVKSFISAPENRQIGLEILILLLDFTFATKAQLRKLLTAKGLQNIDRLDDLLDKYVQLRFINYFCLSAYEMDSVPDDAFCIYCLDHASRHILSHFYRDDVAVTWKSTNAIRSAELVSKYLATNEFYLSTLDAKAQSLRFFQPIANFAIRSREIRMSAMFEVMNGETPRDFILEVIRASDLPVNWRKKVNEQVAPFLVDKFWSKYFRTEPVFIFLSETKEQAEEVSDIFYLRTESLHFRVTTDSDIRNGIDRAKFYKYDPQAEATKRLVPVNVNLFRRDVAVE